jgi:prevent-host-death family protein
MKKDIRIVTIDEAKKQLSKLVDQVSKGEPFIIAKAGKPLVKVLPGDAPVPAKVQRLGFMAGQSAIPEDFDEMGSAEIGQLFEGEDEATPVGGRAR